MAAEYSKQNDTIVWRYECGAGSYYNRRLSGLLWDILEHRWSHWRRGEGWRD